MDGWMEGELQMGKSILITFKSPLLLLKLCFFGVYVTVNYEINAVNRYSLGRVHPLPQRHVSTRRVMCGRYFTVAFYNNLCHWRSNERNKIATF